MNKKVPALILLSLLAGVLGSSAFAEEQPNAAPKPSWKPQIYIYQPPAVEKTTSTLFQTVDPQIIQKLIVLLEEDNLGKEISIQDNPSIAELKTYQTPEGRRLENRYTRLGVVLSESLGWEQIKHIRVISEQNLKQRLTTVARWDHTPNVRCIALIALASLKDKNDIVYFQEALWSKNIGIRYATIEALAKWGYPEAIPLLQGLAQKDESYLIRVMAAGTLAKLGDPMGFNILRANFSNKDWLVRSLTAKFLGEVGNVDDYELLVNQIDREQSQNTNEFVLAEISVGALNLLPQKIEKEKLEREAKKKKKNPQPVQPEVKKEEKPRPSVLLELEPLVVTAPRLRIPQNEPIDPRINFQLLKMLQQKADLRVSAEMANQSTAYNDLNNLVTPNGIMLKARYTMLGFLLTEGVAGTKDFQILDELIRLARESKDSRIRAFAMNSLAYSKDWTHFSIFQTALRSDDPAERFAAIEAIQIAGLKEGISILIGVNKLDRSPILKVYAAQAILRMGDPLGKDYLLRALDDPDWVARAMAMRYLGELGKGEDYNRLLSFFTSDQTKIVQAEMCSALLRLYAAKMTEEQAEKNK